MKKLIRRYEGYKEVLVASQQLAIKELGFIHDEQETSDTDSREFMSEVMDTISYLNGREDSIDRKIKRLKKDLEEERA